ncbi:MAG: putative C-S lyase [Trueperaceae bacterium]|nr:putative C-S lyase [Trueperaceae bacterium]
MTHHPYDDVSLAALRERPGAKWTLFPADVLPLWVAEMDYPLAGAVKDAIRANLDANDLGYPAFSGAPGLREAVAERLSRRHGLSVLPEEVEPLPTTGAGLGLAARAFAGPGDEVLLLTPLYPPFKKAVEGAGRVPVEVELRREAEGYAIDFAALEAAVTPATRLLMLCSPHNPIGKVFSRAEVEALAAFALRHNLWVVSDDLHADLLLDGKHLPLAAVSPEIAARTLTLYGPTKAFNIPGLKISFAVSKNPAMLARLTAAGGGLVPAPNVLAQVATIAAYRHGNDWLESTLGYLRGNRDRVVSFVRERLPSVGVHSPAATYLAWLDLRATGLGDAPAKALAERAKVGLNEGSDFGKGGAGFVRLNFATSRTILDTALERLASVL